MPAKIRLARPPDAVLACYNTALLAIVRDQAMQDRYYTTGLASADAIRLHAWMTAATEHEDEVVPASLRPGWQKVIREFSRLFKLTLHDRGVVDDLRLAIHDAIRLVREVMKRQYGISIQHPGRLDAGR